ncbi:MAG: hypothetical protein CK540_00265 [Thermoleophilia bacterium]|nr:MAG: hypothetical protein CK540_00265 [Thermoleophilia bacterium]
MTEPIGMWIGLGLCAFLPFLGIGAAIRPIWIALAMAVGASAIWLWGLGVAGFGVAVVASCLGVFAGSALRRFFIGFRARRVAARTNASSGEAT